jgi:cation:H+ antiporter
MGVWGWVAVFAGGAALLVRAGAALAAAADEVADRTGLRRLFAGALIMAVVTSLPELVTDVAAVRAGSPDLAVGDLLGSSMANVAILAGIDLLHRGGVRAAAGVGHARLAAVAVTLTALAALAVVRPPGVSLGWVGLDTIGMATAYVAALAWLRRREGMVAQGGPERDAATAALAIRRLVVSAAGVVAAAPVVAVAARKIARGSGISETAMGTALLALTTSAPELVTSLAAVRLGAHDLAVGNLFGSNAANMALLVVVDAAATRGPLLASVDPAQVVAALVAIVLMALALAATVGGTEVRVGRLEPDAVVVLVAYVAGLVAVAAAAG